MPQNKSENITKTTQASVLPDEIKDRKKRLVKFGSLAVFSLVIIIFFTIAWFTSSSEAQVGDMQIGAQSLPFDIATKGAAVRNSEVISSLHSEYLEGTPGTYKDTDNSVDTYYSGDSLRLRFDPLQADDADTPDTNESYLPDISPGSSGELSLYVIPKTNESQKVKVSLNVVAFAEIDDMTVSGKKKIIEIKDASDFASKASAVNNTSAAKDAADYVAAANYLKGHILFFGGQGDTANSDESLRYYYTTPYTARTFNKTIAAENKGKAVKVPIYWMWTNTLGQILLPDNTSGQLSGYPIVADTDSDAKSAVKDYVINNRSDIFKNNGESTVSDINSVAAGSDSSAFRSLSTGYNEADYMIGTKIAYFMIDVTVEPAV